MIIGIEGQRIFREKKHGMDMVALELIRNLMQIDHENEYYIFVKPDKDVCLQNTENFHIIEVEGGSYPSWEQFALPKAAEKYKCEILHCTSNTAPLKSKIPLVVTLHDIIYMEKNPLQIISGAGTPYQKFGNLYRRFNVPRMLKEAQKVITVSEFERERIADYFKITDDRLVAIHNGVGEHFCPVTSEEEKAKIKEKYQLPEQYFFFLGNTDPKKNTAGVLKAYADFKIKTQSDIQLVMLDYEEKELLNILSSIGHPEIRKNIHLTGYVNNTELPAIYAQSELFLYPSLRESFGIPAIEAMRCEAAVITSTTSSMPEVSGDAAYFVDPFKPEEITNAMIKLTTNPELKQNLIAKGKVRAQLFSWKKMAEEILKIYQNLN